MNATSRPTPPDFPPKKMGPKSKKKKKKRMGKKKAFLLHALVPIPSSPVLQRLVKRERKRINTTTTN
jgi:hypothetical protein